jgi:LPS-assembly protein
MAEMVKCLLSFFFALVTATAALAQDRATLLADSLAIVGGDRLVASGNVEILFHGQYLSASRLIYDASADRLTIDGPITIDDGNGNVFLADQAQLSGDLSDGILTSARVVFADRLQMAAAEVVRSDGGSMTGLVRVVASSCKVCGGRAPLWEIRAKSVLHDADAQQLYFSGAQFRFAGVPIFYMPHLRLPDPTLDRATGFLIPSFSSSTSRGFGVRFPYFITLGASKDLTLTPFLTNQSGRTLELRYRQALRRGDYMITGSFSQDEITKSPLRGYLQGEGTLALPLGFTATAKGLIVTDRTYLSDYGISDADRLDSRLVISRTKRNGFIEAQVIGYQSLREGESNVTLPILLSDLTFHRRFSVDQLGGQGGFLLETHSHLRPSSEPTDLNGDGIADGRDVSRISFSADWRRNWIVGNGLVIATMAAVYADNYLVWQDSIYGGQTLRTHAVWAAEMRWPLVKSASGGSHMIEPIAQIVLAAKEDGSVLNEDSTLVEFDEANLFELNRFPGTDGKESGVHLNFGGNYLFQASNGYSLGATAGRVVRLEDESQFSDASGLSGIRSDWLVALSVRDKNGLSFSGRALLDDDLTFTKSEARFSVLREAYSLSLGWTDLIADPAENRTDNTQEIVLASSVDVSENWTFLTDSRYNLLVGQPVSTGAGLAFLNECIKVNLSVSRQYGSSTSVRPATDYGLTVELLGFGSGDAGPTRQCRK